MLLFSEGFDLYASNTDLADRGYIVTDLVNTTIEVADSQFGTPALKMIEAEENSLSSPESIYRALPFGAPQSNTLRMFFRVKTTVGYNDTSDDYTSGEQGVGLQGAPGAGPSWGCKIGIGGGINVQVFKEVTNSFRYNVSTGTIPINDGAWHRVEIEFVIDNSVGSVKTWIDGVQDTNISGIDTFDPHTSGFDWTDFVQAVISGGSANLGGSDIIWYDDVLIWDDSGGPGALTGELPNHDIRILTLVPTGEGDNIDFTPLSGTNNSAMVDELVSDDDGTYVESGTDGHNDLHDMEDLPSALTVNSVVTVNHIVRARNSDVGTIQFKQKVKSGATVSDGPDETLGTTLWADFEREIGQDPNTAADWTEAGLNAAQFGYEVVNP